LTLIMSFEIPFLALVFSHLLTASTPAHSYSDRPLGESCCSGWVQLPSFMSGDVIWAEVLQEGDAISADESSLSQHY